MMEEYGYMINGQLIRQSNRTEHSKPIVYTKEPSVDEYHATAYEWQEEQDRIIQIWFEIEIEPVEPSDEISDSEALAIIMGGVSE